MNKIKIKIKGDFIKLSALLKFSNTVESGGFAKEVILNKQVTVNNIICTIKSKKIFKGDTVKYLDNIIEVI